MKKGQSIGLLFIALGLLFLANNLNLIQVSVSELIRVYWPIILIWIGVDRLLTREKGKKE
ncbi:MAG: LiaI-LiaF-like domain-containing protein [Flavobacteriales bacterium]